MRAVKLSSVGEMAVLFARIRVYTHQIPERIGVKSNRGGERDEASETRGENKKKSKMKKEAMKANRFIKVDHRHVNVE